MSTTTRALSVCALALAAGAASADISETIDFEGLVHGEIVDAQFEASHGVHISAQNLNRGFDLAVAFDTERQGTRDRDLESPWSSGNLAPDTYLGMALIIQENNVGVGDGVADLPDDEGRRPAGSILLEYKGVRDGFGFDVIDLESATAEMSSLDFYLDGALVRSVDFAEFLSGGEFGDSSIVYGDNSANRIDVLSAGALGIAGFDAVRINVGGSMAFDNITATPTPGTMAMLGIGGACLARRRRA